MTDAADGSPSDGGSGTGGGGSGGGGDARGGAAGATPDSGDAASSPTDASAPTCLPSGEEHLVIHIVGTPPLDVTNPSNVQCLSRYLPGNDDSGAQLNFDWIVGNATLSVVVRLYDALPGQTGTYPPFAVSIVQGNEGWLGLQNKCHVSITASQRIGSGSPADYKVTGSLACDAGWALGKPNDVLQQFDFTTRVVGYP
jgi:hypothetical protein